MKKMAIIASKGTLDMAYPPFILASTAAALGFEVQVFFMQARGQVYQYSKLPVIFLSSCPAPFE